jgi:hypothetical protein
MLCYKLLFTYIHDYLLAGNEKVLKETITILNLFYVYVN